VVDPAGIRVTGLLDGAGALAQIAALLNQILAILNGL
jgi:hypothetical protein